MSMEILHSHRGALDAVGEDGWVHTINLRVLRVLQAFPEKRQRPDVGVEARGDELVFQRVEGEVVD